MEKKPITWITKNGKHIPIYNEPSADEKKKEREIAGNEQESSQMNGQSDLEKRKMSLKYEEKKWAKRQGLANRNRELSNLESGADFINEHFGDVSDLIGQVLIRNGSWQGLYDREGFQGRGRATYFNGSGYIGEALVVHEFTHAISEEIASHYKKLGFSSESEVFSAIRSEVYKNLNKQEPTYDGRKWAHRPEEYISRKVEFYGDRRELKRDALYKGNTDFVDSPVSAESAETLKVLKKWWKKIGR